MAKPTLRSALQGAGFSLASSYFNGNSSDRAGTAMTHHYTLTRPYGNTTITHHVFVDEYGRNPDKPDVSYTVTHNGEPFQDGYFDTLRRHRDNYSGGVKDPIAEILTHHGRVNSVLSHHESPPMIGVTPHNLRDLNAFWPAHTRGGGLESEVHLGPSPSSRLQSLNAAQDRPLDAEVYRVLTSGTGGHRFLYQGRFPGDDGTDLYQVAHPDPMNPNTFEYGFTVRHRPGQTQPFSYNAMRYQSGVGDSGEEDPGSFLDVTGNMDHVANFGTLPQLVRRHQDMLRALNIKTKGARPRMSAVEKTADEFDNITGGSGYAGPCWACGKATYHYPPETSFRDDKAYPINAEEETGGEMHGPDINLCGTCSVDEGAYHAAVHHGSKGPGRLWHYSDDPSHDHDEDEGWEGGSDAASQRFSSNQKLARLMDQADEDLRP